MGTIIHHYTNIDVLALILKYRTLRFTRLDFVDDPEESNFVSNGVNLGLYTFVTCWTEMKEESIPMWKMYTKGKWGVRLSFMKEGLFKTYKDDFSQHDGFVSSQIGEPFEFLYPIDVIWKQSSYMPLYLLPDYNSSVFYRKIKYVDDVKKQAYNSVQITTKPNGNTNIEIEIEKAGSYKNNRWKFQEESRFVLHFIPGNPIASLNTRSFKIEQSRLIQNIKQNKDLGFSYYDMHLSDMAFDNLIITLSPLSDASQWAIVDALCDKYASGAKVVESNLKGKLSK